MRWPMGGLIAVAVFVLAPAAWGQQPENSNWPICRQDPDIDNRIAACTRLINGSLSTADRAAAHLWRGTAWYIKADFDRAMTEFDAVVRVNPAYAPGYSGRGAVWREMGDYDRAIAEYNGALARDPNAAGSLYGRGLAKHRKGDIRGGDADIAAATKLQPNIASIYPLPRRAPALGSVPAPPALAAPAPLEQPRSSVAASDSGGSPEGECTDAAAHWKSAEALGVLAAYEDHLARFPSCNYATLAKLKIQVLQSRR